MLSFKPTFSLSSFTFIKRLFSLLGLPHCRQTLYHLSHQGRPLDHSGLPEKFFRKNSRKTSTTSLTTLKSLTVWITTNLKILKEMGIPDHLFCLLINLYAGQEATVRTGHRTTDCFQIGKGVGQGCMSVRRARQKLPH